MLILLLTGLTLETAGASPPQNNYTVTNGDTTCIVMTAGIQLTIPYPGQTQVSKTVFCLKSYNLYVYTLGGKPVPLPVRYKPVFTIIQKLRVQKGFNQTSEKANHYKKAYLV